MLYRVYVQFRSKTLDENMQKLFQWIHERTTDVRAVRALSNNVLTGNVKILSGVKGSPYQWFKTRSTDLQPYEDKCKDHFVAFEIAMGRLESTKPGTWTVLNMCELASRMINDIKQIDQLYKTLVECRLTVIDLKREALKGSMKAKHTKAIHQAKLARPWIDAGANKKIMTVLQEIGACWVLRFFVMPVCLKIFETDTVATQMKCVILRCWMKVL